MTKEQIKVNTRKSILNKNIILFGAGEVAEEFYYKNKDLLKISHCVSNIRKQWGECNFLGVLDIREFRADQIGKDDYLIVCGPYAFRQIEIQLLNCGLQMFEDFVESSIAECLLKNKKIVLFRGSCILRDIYESVLTAHTFNEQYAAIYATDNYVTSKFDNRVLYYASKICDYYVYSYRILRQDKVYLLTDEELPSDCFKISMSNITFPGYWPQADPEIRNSNKYLIHPYNMKRDLVFYHTMYRMEDININRYIEEGKGFEEIFQLLSRRDYYDPKMVRKNLRVAFKSLQIAEQFADIGVIDFLKENYQKKMLFQNFSHMHKCVIWTYVRRLFEKLHLSVDECDQLEEKSPNYIHHGGDIPIYPSVAESLELEWYDKNMKYEIMTYTGTKEMTFEQYVAHYVEYTQKARKIIEMW